MLAAHILIADDEALIRQSLRSTLVQEGFEVSVAASGEQAWQLFQSGRPDVVLLDLVLGDQDGLEILRRIKQDTPEAKVLLMSAYGSIESAVQAMKLGGYDFIRKPFELEEIVVAVRNAIRTSRLETRVEYLAQKERSRNDPASFVYKSPVMQKVMDEVRIIAQSPVATVLVFGESGVGKQHIARTLHDLSARAAGPFVELNCSAVPENLVESEFFGHERGAFSDARDRKLGLVEVADGGTLFLDEVGDLGAAAQAKLLTFLEQRTFRRVGATTMRRVDTRIVAATNRDLSQLVGERSFRTDLWYRLNAMTITVPPLRARQADIVPLVENFLRIANREFRRTWTAVTPQAATLLCNYAWPGNVRELRAVVQRATLLHDDQELGPQHLPQELRTPHSPPTDSRAAEGTKVVESIRTLAAVELEHIRRVLDQCHGNRTLAAQHLGITRQTLTKKIDSSEDEA